MSSQPAPISIHAPVGFKPRRSYLRQVLSDAMIQHGAQAGVFWIGLLVLCAVFAPFLANTNPLLVKQAGVWSSPLIKALTIMDVLLLVSAGAAVLVLFWPRQHTGGRVLVFLTILAFASLGALTPETLWPFIRTGRFKEWELFPSPFSYGKAIWWFLIWIGLAAAVVITAAFVIAVLRSPKISSTFRAVGLIVAVVLAVALTAVPIHPPHIVYDQYREKIAAGTIEKAIFVLIPYSPDDRLRDQPELRLTEPTSKHMMGTTVNGADLMSNMIYASRIALSIGFISTGIAVLIGVVIGGLMGYYSGWVDLLGMRLVEIFSAVPTLYLLLAFVAFFEPNLYIMMVIIGLTSWPGDAVFIRAEFLRLRQQDFVQAGKACGLPLRSILFKHMLPNGVTPVLINASFGVAGAILAESTLSFLGIGLVEEASWGKLLNDALGVGGTFYWWIALYPGLAIFLTVFAYNLIGEALRDAMDPRLKKAAML